MEETKPKQIEIPVWWKPGGDMIYRRDCLPEDHPEHTYNYVKNNLGVIPEKYGVYHPRYLQYKDWTRKMLMSRISELEQQLKSIEPFL